jgi:tetratricopeptide (TPR) repeat protein
VLDRVSKVFLTVAVAAAIGLVSLPVRGQGQSASQPAQKNWKDRAEYDLYNAIVKEQNLTQKITLLNSWKEKYPTSDYAQERLQFYLQTYFGLNQPDKVIATANEMLQHDPKNLTALYYLALSMPRLTKPSPDDLSAGEKAANGLISNLESFRPPNVSDADWTKARTDIELQAHTALGWIAMQKKDPEAAKVAETEFHKVLELNSNNAQVSYWLGTSLLQQKKPELMSAALYQFGRAASLEPAQGGFPADARKTIDTYFVNAYTRYHGQDDAGLTQLRELAKSQPFPPADFKIKDVNELKAENEEEFRKKNPALAMWMTLKQALNAPDGEQYFNDKMKGADVPGGAGGVDKFKGKLISMKPAIRPKELTLAIVDANTPEVTLNLDSPLPGKADPGIEISFSGVPASFTKEPFNMTFDVEKKNIAGWPAKEAAPPRRTGAKKGATRKKQED